MANNQVKRTKEENEQRNNLVVNRMMMMFVLTTIAVVLTLMLKKGNKTEVTFVLTYLPILQIISGILFAGVAVFFIIRKVNKVDEDLMFLSSTTLLILAATLFGIFMLYTTIGNAYVVIGIIGMLVICFVYNFFQKEYFWYTIFQTVTIVMVLAIKITSVKPLWMQIGIMFSKIFIFLIPIVIIVGLMIVKKNNGILTFKNKRFILMRPKSLYYPFFVGAGAAIISGVISLLLQSLAIYAIIALFAIYLVFGIIYAVKMI